MESAGRVSEEKESDGGGWVAFTRRFLCLGGFCLVLGFV